MVLAGLETDEKLLALILGAGLLLYVGYRVVSAHRRTLALYVFLLAGAVAAITITLAWIAGWDGRSLLRLTGFWVLIVIAFRFLCKGEEGPW